jgi:hypothetical protein
MSFSANGSHALYPTAGTHDHTIPNLNLPFALLLVDETDDGPIYDPLPSAYFYTYDVASKRFTPYRPEDPVGFLNYRGHWGDQQYPDDDPRQLQLVGTSTAVPSLSALHVVGTDSHLSREQEVCVWSYWAY